MDFQILVEVCIVNHFCFKKYRNNGNQNLKKIYYYIQIRQVNIDKQIKTEMRYRD